MAAPTRRTAALVVAAVLVAAGIATFVLTDGLAGLRATHLLSAVLVASGLGVGRLATRRRRGQSR